MKVLIIEGPDNCGKDTLIKNISSKFNIVKIIHCEKPKATTPELALLEQSIQFNSYANVIIKDYKIKAEDIAIFNRYHYGEYIYGQIYRGENSRNILNMIRSIDNNLKRNIKPNDICYIQLMSDSEEFLFRNDDGLSLSGNKKELIKQECKLFREIFNYSNIANKHLVYVNKDNEFRDQTEITNEVLTFLNIK